jgi:hypothetical protein
VSTDPTAAPPGTPETPPDPNRIDWAPYTRAAVIALVAGAVLYLGAGFANLGAAEDDHAKHAAKARFLGAYLSGYIYWLSLPIGGMALLMIGHLAKASWSRLLRKPFEAATRTWPLLAVLWIPLVIAVVSHDLSPYWWTSPPENPQELSANPGGEAQNPGDKRDLTIAYGKYMIKKAEYNAWDARVRGNYGFLTVGGFIGVGVVLFAIWGGMIFVLNKWGRQTTTGSREQVNATLTKLSNFSGPGIIVYAITITAAATQWAMSLEAGWASTMFPVIFAVNQFLTCYAFCLALFLVIASRSPVKEVMRPKFQLDMATLLLAFTLFWTYTSFSQFMLVWIGNLPEEIPFFLKRSAGGWWWVSAALAALHFALPFLLLLFRDIKLHPKRLRYVAVFLLVICGVDVVWWIAPANPQGWNFYWVMDIGAVLAIGGLWALFFFYQLRQAPILPTDETFLLPEGHHHEHH